MTTLKRSRDATREGPAVIGGMHHTLVWREVDGWWPVVLEALALVRQRDGRHAVRRELALNELHSLLQKRFSHVRLFHGCRPSHAEEYYRYGIRRHDQFVLDRARAIFSDQGIPTGDIEIAIANTDLRTDQGRIFLALDEKDLIANAGHYMIYGSESVMAVGADLIRLGYHDAQAKLSRIGRPALFTCDLPVGLLLDRYVREIAESLYSQYRLSRGRRPRYPALRDHTVVVHADIPASALVSHTSPIFIPDWHRDERP
jgi:hypothetical protein